MSLPPFPLLLPPNVKLPCTSVEANWFPAGAPESPAAAPPPPPNRRVPRLPSRYGLVRGSPEYISALASLPLSSHAFAASPSLNSLPPSLLFPPPGRACRPAACSSSSSSLLALLKSVAPVPAAAACRFCRVSVLWRLLLRAFCLLRLPCLPPPLLLGALSPSAALQ